ncbi:MAG: redoxin domain-containing protein [Galactobacter sp.]
MAARPAVGQSAPDFGLVNQHGETVRLADLVGSPALLVFFPLVLTPVCEQELEDLAGHQERWDALGVRVLGISVDHRYSLREAADRLGLEFDLLSDFWPHGEVSSAFGAFDDVRGHATRTTFVLDGAGTVRAVVTSDRITPRDPHEYERILAAL